MSANINISIPTPCHENWQDMTVADKGRFCASCQKNVVDFTQSSDRHIAEVFKKEGYVCGRFLKSQLERDLVIPKEKNRWWMAASAAVVAFVGLGSGKVFAQTVKTETVQVEKDTTTINTIPTGSTRIITGTVVDDTGLPIPGTNVINLTTEKGIQTDFDGVFAIDAKKGDILVFTFRDFGTATVVITDVPTLKITLESSVKLEEPTFMGYGSVRTSKAKSK